MSVITKKPLLYVHNSIRPNHTRHPHWRSRFYEFRFYLTLGSVMVLLRNISNIRSIRWRSIFDDRQPTMVLREISTIEVVRALSVRAHFYFILTIFLHPCSMCTWRPSTRICLISTHLRTTIAHHKSVHWDFNILELPFKAKRLFESKNVTHK